MPAPRRVVAAACAAAALAACGSAGERTTSQPRSTSPNRSEAASITWQVLVGVEQQQIATSDLGVADRDAWLAAHPRLVIAAGNFRLGFPFVADPQRRDAVQLIGYFALPLGGDEVLALTAPTAAPGQLSGLFEIYLVQDGGPGPALLAGQSRLVVLFDIHSDSCSPGVQCMATRVDYRLKAPGTGPQAAAGTVSDAVIPIGAIRVRLFVPDISWAQPT